MVLNRESAGYVEQGVVSELLGSTGYKACFGKLSQRLEIGNTSYYINKIAGLSTLAKVTQTWTSERYNQSFTIGQIKIPRYLVTADYFGDKVKESVFEKTIKGVSFRQTLDKMCIQAISQKVRFGALFGFQEQQGILNFGIEYTFGNDTAGNDNANNYDELWFKNKIVDMITEMLNSLQNRTDRLVILSSRRMIQMINSKIMKIYDGQKDGGGVDTMSGLIKRIGKSLGVEVEIVIDDTLKNANADRNKDIFALIAPNIKIDTEQDNLIDNINAVGDSTNTIDFNTGMDIGATGRTIHTMLPDNAMGSMTFAGSHTAVVTSGFVVRDEAVMIAHIKYI